MIRTSGLAALLCTFAIRALAQPPAIGQNGVFNSASRIPPTLPGGSLARGALFTINGVRLGTAGTTTVALLHAGTRVSVNLISTQPRRIEARVPPDAPLGESSLVVEAGGETSKSFAVDVVASNPGLFSRNGQGWGPGLVDNLDARGRATPNAFDRPAKPGQRLRFFSTGLGGVTAIHVVIGNRTVTGASVQRGQRPGQEQITVRIPADAQPGCYVPLYLDLPPARASNVVTVAIASGSTSCDSGPVPLLDQERPAFVLLSRTNMRAKNANVAIVEDHALATFAHKDNLPVLSPLLLLPPVGTCTTYTGSFQSGPILATSISDALVSDLGGSGLDAGPHLLLARGRESHTIPRIPGAPGLYKVRLGTGDPMLARRAFPLFLDPDEFLLSSGGGKDLGGFRLTVKGPAPLEWTDRDQHAVVDRGLPLTVRWPAEPRGRVVVILATNIDQITTAIGTCLCTAQASAGRFVVPPALLANIPASIDIPGIPYDRLFVAALPPHGTAIAISGLNGGAAISLYAEGRFVSYR